MTQCHVAAQGFGSGVVPRLVAAKIREMDLSDFENKQAGSLSGGNQRKLSVAIATIGKCVISPACLDPR